MKSGLLFALVVAATAVELTPATWAEETAGKSVFLKFFAPWCGHCKKMKPDWDKLMGKFAGSDSVLVADVDCTAGGKPLCDDNGVKGFPTLKFGAPDALESYEGGRDYAALEKFAGEMKPKCGPSNMDLCTDDEKASLQKLFDLDDADLATQIEEGEAKMKEAESTFSAEVEKLQATYSKLQSDKDEKLAAIKDSGLAQLKAVKAAKGKKAAAKAEL